MSSITCAVSLFLLAVAPSSFVAGNSQTSSFSYDPSASNGPYNWGDLAIDNNACSGNSNSPIALNSTVQCDIFGDYIFETGNCPFSDLTFELLSNVVEAGFPESDTCSPGTMQVPGVASLFEVVQFHIHASSEHSLDDEFYDAELHIVHRQQNNDNRLAVVGIFIVSDSEDDNLEFDTVLTEWEDEYNDILAACSKRQLSGSRQRIRRRRRRLSDDTFNIYNLIPEGTSFYNYNGSLTTPPCSEIVDWSVAEIPLFISQHQYSKLVSIIRNYRNSETCEIASVASSSGSTSRPIQPHNNRKVQHICSSSTSSSEESRFVYALDRSSAAIATIATFPVITTFLVGMMIHTLL